MTVALSALDRDAAAPPPGETETATFGLGCFWGPDARFGAMDGVVRTQVGYAGGTESDPSYYALGDHTEVVQVEFDPDVLDYEALLGAAWSAHDPFSEPFKRQYRGVVLTHDERQRAAAERSRERLANRTGKAVRTPVEPLEDFHLAEDYHQKYELRSLEPVVDELRGRYGDRFVHSTVAARLNGFLAGHGTDAQRRDLLADLTLSPEAIAAVRDRL